MSLVLAKDVFIFCLRQRRGESLQHLGSLCVTTSLRNNEGGVLQQKDVLRSREHIPEGSDTFDQRLPAAILTSIE
jgi:hypothetical protein